MKYMFMWSMIVCEVWWMWVWECLEVNVINFDDYVEGVLTCTLTHTIWMKFMIVNGELSGGYYSWIDMKCLEPSLQFL